MCLQLRNPERDTFTYATFQLRMCNTRKTEKFEKCTEKFCEGGQASVFLKNVTVIKPEKGHKSVINLRMPTRHDYEMQRLTREGK